MQRPNCSSRLLKYKWRSLVKFSLFDLHKKHVENVLWVGCDCACRHTRRLEAWDWETMTSQLYTKHLPMNLWMLPNLQKQLPEKHDPFSDFGHYLIGTLIFYNAQDIFCNLQICIVQSRHWLFWCCTFGAYLSCSASKLFLCIDDWTAYLMSQHIQLSLLYEHNFSEYQIFNPCGTLKDVNFWVYFSDRETWQYDINQTPKSFNM